MTLSNFKKYYLFFLLAFFSSCGSNDAPVSPTPNPNPNLTDTITHKFQIKIGTASGVSASTPLGDTVAVELNPNDLTKVSAEFSIMENDVLKTSDFVFSITPDLPSLTGVTVTETGGICKITIKPENYHVIKDVKFLILATIGTTEKTKIFVIKGKSIRTAVTTLNLVRKPNKESVSLTAGGKEIDLKTVFDVSFVPNNVTDSSVIWTIDPVNEIAYITSNGILTPLSDGTVTIKVTSNSDPDVSSTTLPFVINPAPTPVKLRGLSLERKFAQSSARARVGKNYNLMDAFNVVYIPSNATDKRIICLIEPPQPNVALITNEGFLSPKAKGTVRIKVKSETFGVWSSTEPFTISSSLELKAKVGSNLSVYLSESLDEDATMEIDPNQDDKAVGMFYVSDSNSFLATDNVSYNVNPEFPTGVNIISEPSATSLEGNTESEPYVFKVDLTTYKITTDETFTMTATIGSGSSAKTASRTFTIKGNNTVLPTSITLVRKTGQESTVVSAGDSDVDLTSIFEVSFVPENTTNKNVKWYLDSLKPEIATITVAGVLEIVSAGEIILLVIYGKNPAIRTTKKFIIEQTNVKVTGLSLTRKSGKTNVELRGGAYKYSMQNIFDINFDPPNASNKNVIWEIVPPNKNIATIYQNGDIIASVNYTLGRGTIMLKVTSVSNVGVQSERVPLTVVSAYAIEARVNGNTQHILSNSENALGSLGSGISNLGSGLGNNLGSIGSSLGSSFGSSLSQLFGTRYKGFTYEVNRNLLKEDVEVILDPNGTDKLSVIFTAMQDVATRSPGEVAYTIEPELPTESEGVTKKDNAKTTKTFEVGLIPSKYTETIDKMYTLTATGPRIKTPTSITFTIKGIIAVPVTSITIARKTDQVDTNGFKGLDVDLTDIFDVTIMPDNATNKFVTWSISPEQVTVATVNEAILTPKAAGTIMLKATSKSQTTVSSTTADFVIEDAKILELTGALPDLDTGKYYVAWLFNGDDKYNVGAITFKETKFVKGGIPVDKVTVNTKFTITVESAISQYNASTLALPSGNGLNLVEIALANIEGAENSVTKFNDNIVPTVPQTFILATPSDTNTSNERTGVWFKKAASATAGLTLPTLTGDFSYEGWIKVGTGVNIKYVSTGKFKNPAVADSERFYYPESTTVPPFPGEDFLVNPTSGIRKIEDLVMPINQAFNVLITLEPTTEVSFAEVRPTSFVLYEKAVTAIETTGVDKTLDKADALKLTVVVK